MHNAQQIMYMESTSASENQSCLSMRVLKTAVVTVEVLTIVGVTTAADNMFIRSVGQRGDANIKTK